MPAGNLQDYLRQVGGSHLRQVGGSHLRQVGGSHLEVDPVILNNFTLTGHLLSLCMQVARGMAYLAANRVCRFASVCLGGFAS